MLPDPSGRGSGAATRRPRTAVLGGCLAAGIALAAGISGCSKFDAALGQQWATVNFKADTPEATVFQVRAACAHIPNVHAKAMPRQRDPQTAMYAVTYQTTNASDANIAQLQQCLQRFPSVAGIEFGDSGDDGG